LVEISRFALAVELVEGSRDCWSPRSFHARAEAARAYVVGEAPTWRVNATLNVLDEL
jgi:hypothetical protein